MAPETRALTEGVGATASERRLGRLAGWETRWSDSTWASRLIRKGLAWRWSPRRPSLNSSYPSQRPTPLLQDLISQLLQKGAIERANPTTAMFVSRIFPVKKKNATDLRMILDLSILNKRILHHKFKMVTTQQVRRALHPSCWMASIDLRDAFYHVPVNPRFKKFLAFKVGPEAYQFRLMPFGLKVAPAIFTRLIRVMCSALTLRGVNILPYLDDWLIWADTPDQCSLMVQETLAEAEHRGLLVNTQKSSLTPTQNLLWLGITWDSPSSSVALPPQKQAALVRLVTLEISKSHTTRREVLRVLGTLNFATITIPQGRLNLRHLTRLVNRYFKFIDLDILVCSPPTLSTLLSWWLTPGLLFTRASWLPPATQLLVITDSSDQGWGFHSSIGWEESGRWDAQDQHLHINEKELKVVLLFLLSGHPLYYLGIRFALDSTTATYCINHMGSPRSHELLSLSSRIFSIAQQRDLFLSASHIPGRTNMVADALSRGLAPRILSDEWTLKPSVFFHLTNEFGLPEVDLLASDTNNQLPLFASLDRTHHLCDALHLEWNQWDHIYLFPPFHMIQLVLCKLQGFRGRVLLVAPFWPARSWFPRLLQWCPAPVPLPPDPLKQPLNKLLQRSLALHAWAFSPHGCRDRANHKQA